MEIKKKLDDEESQEFWRFAERVSIEVASWPAWKRGAVDKSGEQSCCKTKITNKDSVRIVRAE